MAASHVFVSHVSEDRSAADEIVRSLEERGFQCWIAPRDLHPGRPYDDEIAAAIDASSATILVFSARCNDNDYIRREVTLAGEARKPVIPVRIEDARPQRGLRVRLSDLHWIDAFPTRDAAIEAIVRALHSSAAGDSPVAADEEDGAMKVLIDRAHTSRSGSEDTSSHNLLPIRFFEETFTIREIAWESIKYGAGVVFCVLLAMRLEGYLWVRIGLGVFALLLCVPIAMSLRQLLKRKPSDPLVIGSDFIEYRGKKFDRSVMSDVEHKVSKGMNKGTTVDTLIIKTPVGSISILLNRYLGNVTPYKNAVAEHVRDIAEGKGDLARLRAIFSNALPESGKSAT